MPARARTDRNDATRVRLLRAAEELFAEQGVVAVSHRAIAEAADQRNPAVVGYHFGAKQDLVQAIAARHRGEIDAERARLLEEVDGSTEVRDWVRCLVLPHAHHLERLGSPSWYARFAAQVATDPVLHPLISDEALASPVLRRVVEGLQACLPTLSPTARSERGEMARILMVHVLAERERALAGGSPTPHPTWQGAAEGLVDAIVAVWNAPDTARGHSRGDAR